MNVKVVQLIARLNIGGPAVYVTLLSKELTSLGWANLLVSGTVESNEGDMGYLAATNGIRPLYVPELGRAISFLDDIKAFFELRRIIRRFSPHIVHTHTAKAGTLGRLAVLSINIARKKREKIRLVHTFHGHIFHSYFGPKRTFLFLVIERILARFTDKIIAISPLQKRDLCNRFRIAEKKKIEVLPLGFDLSSYECCNEKRSLERGKYISTNMQNKFLVGTIGRLTPIKNHQMLLHAISILRKMGQLHKFKFLVVGDGELKRELVKKAKELEVREEVVFTGWKRNMPAIYGALDTVVLTSGNEGTPVTIIEAMAAGKPVVATGVGGVPDLLGNIVEESPKGFALSERGISVPSDDADALAEAILFLERNRPVITRIVQKARHFVLERYSSARMIMDIERLYASLEGIEKVEHHPDRKEIWRTHFDSNTIR